MTDCCKGEISSGWGLARRILLEVPRENFKSRENYSKITTSILSIDTVELIRQFFRLLTGSG